MKITNVWITPEAQYMYLEKDGKIYKVALVPYRKLKDADLKEMKSPMSNEDIILHAHGKKPTESFLVGLKFYGLELAE